MLNNRSLNRSLKTLNILTPWPAQLQRILNQPNLLKVFSRMLRRAINLEHDKVSKLLLNAKTNLQIQVRILTTNFLNINKTQEEMWTQ
jgi:hypothetical protein